jgi:hypothetical protein
LGICKAFFPAKARVLCSAGQEPPAETGGIAFSRCFYYYYVRVDEVVKSTDRKIDALVYEL